LANDWQLGELAVTIGKLTPALQAFFARWPMVVADAAHSLHGRIMLSTPDLSPQALRNICGDYDCRGLERLKIFSTQALGPLVMKGSFSERIPVELHDLTLAADPAADFCRT